MIDTDTARSKVEVHPELSVLLVRGLEHLLVPQLTGEGGDGEHQLVGPQSFVETVQEGSTVDLEILNPHKE